MTIRNLIKKEEACGAGVKAFAATNSPETVKSSYTTEGVKVRTITNALSSSGTLEPANSYTVKTLASAEILSDTFEEGDLVEKDQLLYTLDSSDAATSQNQAQPALRRPAAAGVHCPGSGGRARRHSGG